MVLDGEDLMSATFTVKLSPNAAVWDKAYYDAREFENLPRQRQREIVLQLKVCLQPISQKLDDLLDVVEEQCDEELDSSVSDLQCFVDSLIDFAHDFLKRRNSWKDFAMDFEMMLDDLGDDDINDMHAEVRTLAEAIAPKVRQLFDQIDSGNRLEAEEKANQAMNDVGDE